MTQQIPCQVAQATKFPNQTVCPNNPAGSARPWRAWLRTDRCSMSFEFATREDALAYLRQQVIGKPIDTRDAYSVSTDRTHYFMTFLQHGREVFSLGDLGIVPLFDVPLPPAPAAAKPAEKLTLQAGSLAFYQSVTAGLVPCKVVTVDGYGPDNTRILVSVTAARGCYPKGYQIDGTPLHVFPRAAVHRVRGSYGLRFTVAPFTVQLTRGA